MKTKANLASEGDSGCRKDTAASGNCGQRLRKMIGNFLQLAEHVLFKHSPPLSFTHSSFRLKEIPVKFYFLEANTFEEFPGNHGTIQQDIAVLSLERGGKKCNATSTLGPSIKVRRWGYLQYQLSAEGTT